MSRVACVEMFYFTSNPQYGIKITGRTPDRTGTGTGIPSHPTSRDAQTVRRGSKARAQSPEGPDTDKLSSRPCPLDQRDSARDLYLDLARIEPISSEIGVLRPPAQPPVPNAATQRHPPRRSICPCLRLSASGRALHWCLDRRWWSASANRYSRPFLAQSPHVSALLGAGAVFLASSYTTLMWLASAAQARVAHNLGTRFKRTTPRADPYLLNSCLEKDSCFDPISSLFISSPFFFCPPPNRPCVLVSQQVASLFCIYCSFIPVL